jgi:hypothetical protein
MNDEIQARGGTIEDHRQELQVAVGAVVSLAKYCDTVSCGREDS